jgi:hypothetical protein
MASRVRSIALGLLLLLLGFTGLFTSVWPEAPLEEPASPGKTPNPSETITPFWEWWLYPSVRIIQSIRYAAAVGGVTCLVMGAMLLAPKRAGPS